MDTDRKYSRYLRTLALVGWLFGLTTAAVAQGRQTPTTTGAAVPVALNRVLAIYQVYANNIHALHWNVRGPHFFVLHEAYEKMYVRSHGEIDDIAERIMALKATPVHTFEDYLAQSAVKTAGEVRQGQKTARLAVDNLTTLIDEVRQTLDMAGKVGDEATIDLLGGILYELEHDHWLLRAFLEEPQG